MLYCRSCKARFSERKGTPLFGSQLTEEKAIVALRAPGRAQRRPRHRTAGGGEPQHGRPLRPPGRRARPPTPRRARGFFPRRPARSSSTRSGRSSSRSRSTATPTTRPMTSAATGGTTWRSTPRAAWSSPWCPGARDAERRRGGGRRGQGADTEGRVLDLVTSDEYPAYETAILEAYGAGGRRRTPTGRPSRKMVPEKVPPRG